MEIAKRDRSEANDSSTQEYKLYWRRWFILAMFSLTAMISSNIWISFSTITSIVKTYYRVNPIFIDWLAIVYSLFLALLLAPGSYLASRFGLRWSMIFGAFFTAFGSCFRLIGARRTMFVFVFIGSSFSGIAQCSFLFLSPHIAATWFGAHERTTASAIGMSVCWSGVGLGFLTGTFFVSDRKRNEREIGDGIRNLLMFEAITSTVLFIMCVIIMKDAPPTPPSRSQEIRYQLIISDDDDDDDDDYASTRTDIKQSHVDLRTTSSKCVPNVEMDASKQTGDQIGQDTFDGESTHERTGHTAPSFKHSLTSLLTDMQSHLLCQVYAIYTGLNFTYTTLLNQITVSAFPGKEKDIGYMGFMSLISGLLSIFLSGVFLNRTQRFKVFTLAVFALATIVTFLLTVALHNSTRMEIAFLLYILFGFVTYPYMSAGMEYAAEVAYPIPEIISSSVCLLLSGFYAIFLTQILGMLLNRGINIGGYIISGLYAFGFILVTMVKSPLKRSSEDNIGKTDTRNQ